MKTNYYPLLVVLISFLIGLNIFMYLDTKEQLEISKENKDFENPVFIWNDDLESMPVDGTPVMLQYTEGDTVYLGAIEEPYK
jgi:hypothetical protein